MPRHSLLTLLAALLTLSSCANFDLEYSKLEAVAETNPKPDAIVGMWHRKATDGWGLQLRQSFLFNRDGTGVDSYYHSDWMIGQAEQTTRFTWNYAGNGVWRTKSTEAHGATWELRMSQGKLIRKAPALAREVLERVPQ
jgi:hypothetical protein